MKKSSFISRVVLVLGLATSQSSFGQLAAPANISSKSLSESVARDKAFENLKAVNVKMHKDFIKHYSTASDIKTFTDKEGTSVSCTIDGVKTRVNYTRNGRWAGTLRMLEANQIPDQLFDEVSEAFPGYKITSGKEVLVGSTTAYLIDLENERKFKTVRIIDGEYDIYQEYFKQR